MDRKSSNPFDLPFDSELEENTMVKPFVALENFVCACVVNIFTINHIICLLAITWCKCIPVDVSIASLPIRDASPLLGTILIGIYELWYLLIRFLVSSVLINVSVSGYDFNASCSTKFSAFFRLPW